METAIPTNCSRTKLALDGFLELRANGEDSVVALMVENVCAHLHLNYTFCSPLYNVFHYVINQ